MLIIDLCWCWFVLFPCLLHNPHVSFELANECKLHVLSFVNSTRQLIALSFIPLNLLPYLKQLALVSLLDCVPLNTPLFSQMFPKHLKLAEHHLLSRLFIHQLLPTLIEIRLKPFNLNL